MRCVVWFIAIFSGVFKYVIAGKSISKETEALHLPLDFFHKPRTNRCRIGSTNKNDGLLIYTSTLAVIIITTIFATLAISKGAKLLDYSSVLSTFGTLFLCLITNSLKDPGYHGCLCRIYTYVCNASCNGSLCYHMAGVYFDNQIIDYRGITRRPYFMPTLSYIYCTPNIPHIRCE